MDFRVSTREVGHIIVLDAAGRFTLGAGGTKLRDSVHVFAGRGHKKFLLNLAGVHFIDSYGIGELVRCYSVIRRMGGDMKLVRVHQSVLDLLQITKLDKLFEIHGEELMALREFQ